MSSTKTAPSKTDPVPATELFLNLVHGVIEAGDNAVTALRNLAFSQGLTSKPMAIAIWRLHLNKGPLKVSDLARTIDCDTGNTSGVLDRLEEAGLIERAQHGSDRRVRLVQLTAKGRKLGVQMEMDYKRTWMYRALKELSPRERETLDDILMRLNASASAE